MIPVPVPTVAPEKVSTTLSATLQTDLKLAAIPMAPSCARRHVRAVAHEWDLAELADMAELVTSELVTNALQASDRLRIGASPPIVPVVKIWLASDRTSLVIHVWDGSAEMPVRQDGPPDQESGRGLMLVENLAKDWGTYRKGAGKVVWALISPDQPPETNAEAYAWSVEVGVQPPRSSRMLPARPPPQASRPMSPAGPDRLPMTMRRRKRGTPCAR
jgi:anti-sigma regulatory factor (Ser/Thr protein kinase)